MTEDALLVVSRWQRESRPRFDGAVAWSALAAEDKDALGPVLLELYAAGHALEAARSEPAERAALAAMDLLDGEAQALLDAAGIMPRGFFYGAPVPLPLRLGQVCRACGCTERDGCVGADGLACSWASPSLCTACASPEEEAAALFAAADIVAAGTLSGHAWPDDAELGMAWWNGLTEGERAKWLRVAGSARPADAWAAFNNGGAASSPPAPTGHGWPSNSRDSASEKVGGVAGACSALVSRREPDVEQRDGKPLRGTPHDHPCVTGRRDGQPSAGEAGDGQDLRHSGGDDSTRPLHSLGGAASSPPTSTSRSRRREEMGGGDAAPPGLPPLWSAT